MTEKWSFLFLLLSAEVFGLYIFWVNFSNFLQWIRTPHWYLRFMHNKFTKMFCLFQHFLLTLKPKSDETARKTINIFYECVIESNFTSISGLGGSNLSNKVKIVVLCGCTLPYCTVHMYTLTWATAMRGRRRPKPPSRGRWESSGAALLPEKT